MVTGKDIEPVRFLTRSALGAFKGNLAYEIVDHKIPSTVQLAIQSRLQRLSYFTTLDFALDDGGYVCSEPLDMDILWSRF